MQHCAGVYFCRVTLHVSGVKRPSSGVLKNWHGGPWYRDKDRDRDFVSSLIWWCDDLPATITPVLGTAVSIF